MLSVYVAMPLGPLVDHTSHSHGLAGLTIYTSATAEPFTLPHGIEVFAGPLNPRLVLQEEPSCGVLLSSS